MRSEMDRYLSRVRLWMLPLPGKARRGIIEELRSHITESAEELGGQQWQGQVISGMDPPRKTAKRYRRIYGYGLPLRVLFVIITIILSILTVPIWEAAFKDFATNFWFLILILFVFAVGGKAGKKMGLTVGIAAFITRFLILGLIAAAFGEHGIIQGRSMFLYLTSSFLLIIIGYLPGRTIEKWEEQKNMDMTVPQVEMRLCPRCSSEIPDSSKFCNECGGRVR